MQYFWPNFEFLGRFRNSFVTAELIKVVIGDRVTFFGQLAGFDGIFLVPFYRIEIRRRVVPRLRGGPGRPGPAPGPPGRAPGGRFFFFISWG